MKNLKKVVALSLAAVMMFGMMVVGAGAATYKDDNDINYKEAVEVMTAIGVINGNDGNFDPQGNLSRNAAAKIVAYLDLTKANAENLAGVASGFADVAANNWASGVIAYCKNQGIIAGDGSGNFDPNGDLQGYAFAKMLLVVLGYNPELQGYVNNADWALNINFDALNAGLLKGLEGIDLSKTLTREQACQMGFNALKAAMVYYTENLTVNAEGNLTVKNEVKQYTNNATSYNQDANGDDGLLNFCEEKYPTLKFATAAVAANAPRTCGWTVGTGVEMETVFTTYAQADVTLKGDKRDLDRAELKGYEFDDYTVNPVVNGKAVTGTTISNAADVAALCGNGVTVDVYATKNPAGDIEVYCVNVTSEILVEVGVTYNATKDTYAFTFGKVAGDANTTVASVSAPAPDAHPSVVAYYNYIVANFAEADGALVLVSTNNGAIVDFAEPEMVSGTTEKYSDIAGTVKSITLSGTEIPYAKDNAGYAPEVDPRGGANQQTAILDSEGNVKLLIPTPGTTAAVTVPNVLLVTEIWTENSIRGNDTHGFEAVTMDGKVIEGVYAVAEDENHDPVTNDLFGTGVNYAGSDAQVDDLTIAVEYKYDEKKDSYTFYPVSNCADTDEEGNPIEIIGAKNEATAGADYENKVLAPDAKYYASDVKFIYTWVDGRTGATKTEVLEGAQVIENGQDYTLVWSKDSVGNFVVSHVFVDDEPTIVTVPEDGIIFMDEVKVNYYTLGADGETKLAAIDVYIDGEKTEIKVVAAAGADMGLTTGFNTYSIDARKGAYVLETLGDVATKIDVESTYTASSVDYVNGKYYVNGIEATDAMVIDLCEEGMVSLSAIRTACKDGFDVELAYFAVIDEDGISTITTIYALDVTER